jgi:hypothetical protein
MVKKIGLFFLFVFLSFSCLSVGAQEPAWVKRPASVYPEARFVSAVGTSSERAQAETAALGLLTSSFRQSIVNSVRMQESERQSGGRSSSTSENSISIEATSALDSLIGAEVKETYNDRQGRTWYAVVVMEKAKCAPLYLAELNKKVSEVNTLLGGDVTFETISRCQKAQIAAAEAEVFAFMLTMLGGANRQAEITSLAGTISSKLTEAKALPIDVRVTMSPEQERLQGMRETDVINRVKSAFTTAFSSAGFRTGSASSRYALIATISIAPATQNRYYNTRYNVDAVLKDTRSGAELFPFNITNRESHPGSQEEANNRAVIGAERKVKEEFPGILQDYLNSN